MEIKFEPQKPQFVGLLAKIGYMNMERFGFEILIFEAIFMIYAKFLPQMSLKAL